MNKALFLDRDGTIIKEIPGTFSGEEQLGYLTEPEQVEIIEGADTAIAIAREKGFKIIVITNQSAIARGWLTEEKLHLINQRMFNLLTEHNPSAVVDDLFYSPYHKDGSVGIYKKDSNMRKPGIGMMLEAQKKHDLDLSESYFIGDSYTDMQCGDKAGTKKILVMTGYGEIAYRKCLDEKLKIDFIAKNLLEAVKEILKGR